MDKNQPKDRHPHSGLSGAAKKGGGGGKGTWGKGGVDDLKEVRTASTDPNYDSEEEVEKETTVLSHVDGISPVEAIIQEYLAEGDIQDTSRSLKELKNSVPHPIFVRKCMAFSMEKQPYEREQVSKLLSALYAAVISPSQMAEGFQQALDVMEDLVLDVPAAADMLGKFIARAIVDEIIPPAFLNNSHVKSDLAKDALALANGLVTDPHRSKKLEHIWGPGDLESVKRLKAEVILLFEEYLTSGDLKEADRCVRKLNAPHFHAQVVKQALRTGLQKSEEQRKKILSLLAFFSTPKGEGLITPEFMSQGFKSCKAVLGDIKLDVPNAEKLFDECVQTAKAESWLSDYEAK